jgi:hypothetical protein
MRFFAAFSPPSLQAAAPQQAASAQTQIQAVLNPAPVPYRTLRAPSTQPQALRLRIKWFEWKFTPCRT